MSKYLITLLLIWIGSYHPGYAEDKTLSEDKLVFLLRSDDMYERIYAMDYITDRLKKGEITLAGELEKTCFDIIEKHMQRKTEIDLSEDEEGHYPGSIIDLAAQITDRRLLDYYLKCLPYPSAVEAIARLGDEGIERLVKYSYRNDLSEGTKLSIMNSINQIIELNQKDISLSKISRRKLKKRTIEMMDMKYTFSGDSEKLSFNDRLKYRDQQYIKIWAIKTCALFGDEDLIPLLREVAEKDPAHHKVKKKALTYLKMTSEEKREYIKKHADESVATEKDEEVDFYPVRTAAENAIKALEERKK